MVMVGQAGCLRSLLAVDFVDDAVAKDGGAHAVQQTASAQQEQDKHVVIGELLQFKPVRPVQGNFPRHCCPVPNDP